MEYTTLDKICENLDFQRKPITGSDRVAGNIPYYGASGIVDYVQDYIFDEKLLLVSEDGANLLARSTPIAFSVEGKTWINNHAHVLRFADNTVQKYVELYLNSISLEPYISGSAQPKLNQKMLNKIPIPLVDKETMELAVSVVERVKQLINIRKKELEELDNLIKSRFVEFFGEPSSNPKGYPQKLLPEIAEYWNGLTYKPEDVSDEGIIVLRSSNIQNATLDFEDTVRVSCKIGEKKYVQDKDILMCSRNGSARLVGKVALIKNIKEPMSFGAFMMIIRSSYYPYLMTYFQLPAFRAQITTGATTTINQITGRMLDVVKVPVPDIEAVNRFAAFVHQVDKFKFKVEKSLNETQQLFDSLMQKYFG